MKTPDKDEFVNNRFDVSAWTIFKGTVAFYVGNFVGVAINIFILFLIVMVGVFIFNMFN